MLESMFPFWAALLANLAAQLLKPLFTYLKTDKFDMLQSIECGGFPSSHSSTVVGLTMAVLFVEGHESTLFAITAIFSLIVIYDAVNVRYYAGKNIELTKQLISDIEILNKTKFNGPIYQEKMKAVLGHKYIEVLGGIIVGITTTIFLYFIAFGF